MKKKNLLIPAAVGLGAMVLGAAIGASSASGTQPARSVPQPQVTVTAPAEVVTETVEVTPEVCLTAFERTGTVLALMAEVQGKASPAIEAAYLRDAAALEALTSGLQDLNGQIDAAMPGAVDAINECKALAK